MWSALGIEHLKEVVHIGVHLLDFIRPAARCPDCVCEAAAPIVREVVPEALTSALRFAQDHCISPRSPSRSPSECWSFSLFWWGLILGIFFTISLVVGIAFLRRCLISCGSSTAASDSEASPAQLKPQAIASPAPALALADGEPANPGTLRHLGILR